MWKIEPFFVSMQDKAEPTLDKQNVEMLQTQCKNVRLNNNYQIGYLTA